MYNGPPHIISAFSADAWHAMFLDLPTGAASSEPLMFFAVVEDAMGRAPVRGGLDRSHGNAESRPSFFGYLHESETLFKYQDEMRVALEAYRETHGHAT
jgi:hypothetical protein